MPDMDEPVTNQEQEQDQEEQEQSFPELHDFEVDVFDAVYPVTVGLVPEGNFRSQVVHVIESFPTATLVKMDTIPDWQRKSTSDSEDYSIDTYELNVYALDPDVCKKIANTIAYRMQQMNFRRLTQKPVKNGNDTRISRIVARYEHRIDANGVMYH